ncbi:GntR family transcriptional regulator [Actinacidiphila bryophytorum]|uniref:GntR family transcriptional regulator n=1 Tax=Actinacidiphila bryophytorum TaxID=1436133 RepID=A0A9W4H0G2_9ACTN|nr:GntR family transcriptional regulator [Actinacidiphila bryophytorum]MBM9438724.1 GntR family transcriptional regulator [Actinacidiphila bryophytorum]MBN6545545.1 GntR family transcriptional regulator [Actinacidiphila bryophytorum]CAG7637581.1 GntR family transcriptional regulator [Actinacidiphila bryophytorum]
MGPKTAKVYETIRAWLTEGELAPGDRLPSERALVEKLNIGRTALRQVLARLVAEGALEVHNRSSYRVPGGVSVETPSDLEPWQIHGKQDLYDNRWVKLELWDVEPPGVERFEHHVVTLQRVAIAAVLDDQDRVLMLWRYRFVPQQWGWELPGGIVDAGEDGKATALREVEEETGWRPRALEHVVTFQPMIGMVDSPHEIFVGRGAEQVGSPTDVEEAGHIEWVPLADIPGLMARGDLMGSGTLVALLHVLANRGKNGPTAAR